MGNSDIVQQLGGRCPLSRHLPPSFQSSIPTDEPATSDSDKHVGGKIVGTDVVHNGQDFFTQSNQR